MNTENIPDLETLVRRRLNGEKQTAADFYDLPATKITAKLITTLLPGINASQRELEAFALESLGSEQTQATGLERQMTEDSPQEPPCHQTAETTSEPSGSENQVASGVVGDSEEIRSLVDRLASRLRLVGETNLIEVLKAILEGKWSRRVLMLVPTYENINPHVMFAMMAQLRKQPWLGFEYEHNTVIQRARNLLAQRFLASEAEWSWWVDADTIPPFKSPGFFYARLGADPKFIKPEFFDVMALERLGAASKSIVGAVYQQRKDTLDSLMVIQPHLHPRNDADVQLVRDLLREGPQNRVIEVDYVATGCALVHRSVYTDIMAKFPERAGKGEGEPFDFFGHDVGVGGEDIAFCHLARESGHKSHLDLGLWCGHLGTKCFFPPKR